MLRRIISLGLLVASLMTSCVQLQAQGAANKGDVIINVGIGVLSPYSYGYSGYSGSVWPAFQISGESIIADISGVGIGLGGSLGFQYAFYNSNNYQWRSSNVFLGIRGTAHFGNVLNWKKGDLYAGLQLGPRFGFNSDNNRSNNNVYMYSSFLVGARYFFKPKFGLFAEVGYDIAYLKAGVSLKL